MDPPKQISFLRLCLRYVILPGDILAVSGRLFVLLPATGMDGELFEAITADSELHCWISELSTSLANVIAAPVMASASEAHFCFFGWLSKSRNTGIISLSWYFSDVIICAQHRSCSNAYLWPCFSCKSSAFFLHLVPLVLVLASRPGVYHTITLYFLHVFLLVCLNYQDPLGTLSKIFGGLLA